MTRLAPPSFLNFLLDDLHLDKVLEKYQANPAAAQLALVALEPLIRTWANGRLLEVVPSGSFSKGTAINIATDADLFISLHPSTEETLKEISDKLISYLGRHGIKGEQRHVAINVEHLGFSIDLVPAKRRPSFSGDHSIYRRRDRSWMLTNPSAHIGYVRASGRQREIRLMKIWRHIRGLDVPSFYIELLVIEALRGTTSTSPASNFRAILKYIGENIQRRVVIDPANTNNKVSDELTLKEKAEFAFYAKQDAARPITDILW